VHAPSVPPPRAVTAAIYIDETPFSLKVTKALRTAMSATDVLISAITNRRRIRD